MVYARDGRWTDTLRGPGSHVLWIVGHVTEAWSRCDAMEQCHRSSSRRNAVRRAHLFTICSRESERPSRSPERRQRRRGRWRRGRRRRLTIGTIEPRRGIGASNRSGEWFRAAAKFYRWSRSEDGRRLTGSRTSTHSTSTSFATSTRTLSSSCHRCVLREMPMPVATLYGEYSRKANHKFGLAIFYERGSMCRYDRRFRGELLCFLTPPPSHVIWSNIKK